MSVKRIMNAILWLDCNPSDSKKRLTMRDFHQGLGYYQKCLQLLEWVFFVIMIDPMAEYDADQYLLQRRRRQQQHYQLMNHQQPLPAQQDVEINSIPGSSDEASPGQKKALRFKRWRRFFITFNICLSLQLVLNLVLNIASDKLARVAKISTLAQGVHDSIQWLSRTLGDPLDTTPALAILIYFNLVPINTLTTIVWPLYCKHHPLDSVTFRFLLSPVAELEHLDGLIDERLDFMKDAIDHAGYKIQLGDKSLSRAYQSNYVQAIKQLHRQVVRQRTLIHLFRLYKWRLRPYVYSPSWFRFGLRLIVGAISAVTVSCLVSPISIFVLMNYVLLSGRCQKLRISAGDCNLISAFTWRDLSMGLVIFYNWLLLIWTSFFVVAMFATQAIGQLKMTTCMKRDLEQCIECMRFMNIRRHQLLLDEDETAQHPADLITDTILTRTLLRYMLFNGDSKRSTGFLSKTLTVMMSANLLATGAVLAAKSMGGTVYSSELLTFCFIGFYANSLVLICAYLLNRALDTHRLCWSILAETYARPRTEGFLLTTDPLFASWRKIVQSNSSATLQHSIKVFGVCLTYKRALEANFYLITLFSLLFITG